MTFDISTLYADTGTAKLANLPDYERRLRAAIAPGADVILTGHGPVWLYLRLAHTLHGIARSLTYSSPAAGEVVVFDHNPY